MQLIISKSCVKRQGRCANFHSYKDLMGDARCLLELPESCHSQPRTALAPSTRHHNNKWPECNCAPAMLYSTSYSSRKCNNMIPLGNQACILRHRHSRREGPVCYKIVFFFPAVYILYQGAHEKSPELQPGHCFQKAPSFSA